MVYMYYWFHFCREPWLISWLWFPGFIQYGFYPPHQPHLLLHSSSHWPFLILFLSFQLIVSLPSTGYSLCLDHSSFISRLLFIHASALSSNSYSGNLPPPPNVKPPEHKLSKNLTSLLCIWTHCNFSVPCHLSSTQALSDFAQFFVIIFSSTMLGT